MTRRRTTILLGVWISTLLIGSTTASAGTIRLSWNPVPGATGYRVYHGLSSNTYVGAVQVWGTNQAEIGDLEDCRPHYLAVKAFNSAGESTQFSNEVEGWPRPEVAVGGPLATLQGAHLTLDIRGKNFQPGASLVLSANALPSDLNGNPLIRVESVAVVSCEQIQALITVEPTSRGFRAMEIGSFPITFEVYNPDSVYGSGPLALDVQLDPARLDINRGDSGTKDRVDGKDLVWLAFAYGASQGQPRFSPDADLNGDGAVDGEDLSYLASEFGSCWSVGGWSKASCR